MTMGIQQSTGSFALCVEDRGLEDLEARKLYQVLPDREAAREGYIRVVDESGEDYMYRLSCSFRSSCQQQLCDG